MLKRTYTVKRNGQIETGDVIETTIHQVPECSIIQTAYGNAFVYRVMSRNNICLFESASPVKALEYGEWYASKKRTA